MVKKLSQNACFSEVSLVDAGLAVEVIVGRSHGGRCGACSGKCGARKSDQYVCLVGPTNTCTGLFNVRLAAANAGLAVEVKVAINVCLIGPTNACAGPV